MRRRDLSRRQFLGASMTGAVAVTLAGCGGAGGVGGLLSTGSGPVDTAEAPHYTLHEQVMRVDAEGQVYALDTLRGGLTQLDPGGSTNWQLPAGTFQGATSVSVDSQGQVFVSSRGESAIAVLDQAGRVVAERGPHGGDTGSFREARDSVVGSDDLVYVADAFNHRIQVLAPDGSVHTVFGALGTEPGQLNAPVALAFDSYGDLHVLSAGNARIDVFDTLGVYQRSYGGSGTGVGQLVLPIDLSIGLDDRCYVVDASRSCVEVFEVAGHAPVGCFHPRTETGETAVPRHVNPQAGTGLFITTA